MEEPCGAGAAAPLRGDAEEPKQGSVLFLGGNEVKSSAVVKYSSAPPQAAFARLQEKTDLKLPPANWLRESAKLGPAGTTILGNSKKSKPFSSFGMAYDFIDSVGNDVDVVSDSEKRELPSDFFPLIFVSLSALLVLVTSVFRYSEFRRGSTPMLIFVRFVFRLRSLSGLLWTPDKELVYMLGK